MKQCCVLIPYFNDDDSLLTSIHSIDRISNGPDVIVVDDGSTNSKAIDIIPRYNGSLNIHLIELEKNQGIEHALNKGLEFCSKHYKYVARLDCGDTCKNSRIQKQINFLEQHPSYCLVGSWADFTDMTGNNMYTLRQPETHNQIKKAMFINAAFTHPSVMFRSSIIGSVGLYPTSYPAAEDYAYFFKIIKKHKTYNIQESLVNCTINPNGISSKKRKIQIKSRIRIILNNFDCSPIAFYGLFRSIFLLYTPRGFTVALKKILQKN
ncbi:glycosyltransferase [Stutzerimonas xanthomarina]|uniref:Glycosyl transferase family 2 n=2 Tax=Stutzerimonas xanthomarina TaxID=271420 RepID=A0A1M5P723_9GAMM|nr:glycosyltransferase [Stutzerimonas xanthomarina]MCP9338561.1 glycosyltransferase [Stutzerimonas xanthomarina]SEH77367.1 Glycosyl transferase family 2 [Stutzerimonas xanthomarina]SHG97515.1 Glycosyl transferase family 2 [Stutzerimonas xanthomarina DSM 18231]